MATKIQFRRDTAANWTAANPVLYSGEIGYVIDNNRFKIGDGVTEWNSMDYWNEVEYADVNNTPTNVSEFINDSGYAILQNLSAVATSGSYTDLVNKPTSITQFGIADGDPGEVLTTDGNGNFAFVGVNSSSGGVRLTDFSLIQDPAFGIGSLSYNSSLGLFRFAPPDVSAVGFSNSYDDLDDKPFIPLDVNQLQDANNLLGDISKLINASYEVQLNSNGILEFPSSGFLGNSSGTAGQITLRGGIGDDSYASVASNDNQQHVTVNDTNITITVNDTSKGASGSTYQWVFNRNGTVRFPDNTLQQTGYTGNYSSLSGVPTIPSDVSELTDQNNLLNVLDQALNTTDDVTFRSVNIGGYDISVAQDGSLIITGTTLGNDIIIRTNDGNDWKFGKDGTLTFPDTTTQSTSGISLEEIKSLLQNSQTFEEFRTSILEL